MLNDKDIEILQYLQSGEKDQRSLKDLSHRFKVSERSIRYYIERINDFFKEEQILLNKGNYEVIDPDFIETYLQDSHPVFFSPELKQKYVYYTLILERRINLTQISEDLQISRSSTKQYVEKIKEDLKQNRLELCIEHKKGLVLNGKEETLRRLQLQVLTEFETLSNTSRRILEEIVGRYKSGISEEPVASFIRILQKDEKTVLQDQAYLALKNYLYIAISETAAGHGLESGETDFFLRSCKEYRLIKDNLPLLETANGIELSEEEAAGITDVYLGIHYSPQTIPEKNEWFEYDLFISKLINRFSRYAGVNLSSDRQLYESLLAHVKPMMYRMTSHIPLQEIDVETIRSELAEEYGIVRRILNELNFFTSREDDQNEIGLLTIHFKAAMKRAEALSNATRKKILIVCAHGYGTSKLIEQQICELYDVEVLDCIPYHYLEQYPRLDETERIITTVTQLKSFEDIPVLQVNTILKKTDFEKMDAVFHRLQLGQIAWSALRETIGRYARINDEDGLKQALCALLPSQLIKTEPETADLLHYLPKENIVRLHEAADWQEALFIAGEILRRNHYVKEQYVKDMVNSFKNYGSYMIIDEGVAIPHTQNNGNVLNTGVSLVLLDEPVCFTDGQPIRILFAFCSKDNSEHLDALVCIANLIQSTDFKKDVFRYEEPQQIYAFLQKMTESIDPADLQ